MTTQIATRPDFTPLSYTEKKVLQNNDFDAYCAYMQKERDFKQWKAIDLERRVRLVKTGLKAAFAALRKQNFLARMNYLCCQSCAGSALSQTAFERFEANKPVTGVVYFHRQDEESLQEKGEVYLAFGNIEHYYYEGGNPVLENGAQKKVLIGLADQVELGNKIVEAVKAAGLSVEWDGSTSTRIKVFATAETVVTAVQVVPEAIDANYPDGVLRTRVLPPTPVQSTEKPVCQLLGTDGNVFALAGRVSAALRKAGLANKATEFNGRLMLCEDYDAALVLMIEYVEIQ